MKNFLYLFFFLFFCFTDAISKTPELAINQKEINRFIEILKQIKKNYVHELNDEEIFNNAIKGILNKLDPHSTYYTKNEYLEILSKTKGEYGGIGIEVSIIDGNLQIVRVIENSPAYEVDLKEGDIILELEDQKIQGMNINDIKDIIYGDINTKLKIKIYRNEIKRNLDFEVQRKILKIDSIENKFFENNILYIKINYFSDSTYEDLFSLLKKNNTKIQGIILDLRDNGGGVLEQAIKISDAFLEKGEIVSIHYKEKENFKKYNASGNIIISNSIPIVLLVNNFSASASEIVTAALKDNKRATVVGNKTFGKGSVQNILPFKNNDAMKLTVALFYRPNGSMIQNHGIEPDIEIDNGAFIKKINNEIKNETDLENSIIKNSIIIENNEEFLKREIDDLQLYIANQIINFQVNSKK
jgi:carboxyl-terminal processing protease